MSDQQSAADTVENMLEAIRRSEPRRCTRRKAWLIGPAGAGPSPGDDLLFLPVRGGAEQSSQVQGQWLTNTHTDARKRAEMGGKCDIRASRKQGFPRQS